jgi:hypothetical protein
MKPLQMRVRRESRRGDRFVAAFDERFDGDFPVPAAVPAEIVVTLVRGDAEDPVFEGGVAAELAELEEDLDEDVLADVFEIGRVVGEAGGETKDAAFVAADEFGEGVFPALQNLLDKLVIRG